MGVEGDKLKPVYLRVVGVNKLVFLKLAAPKNGFPGAWDVPDVPGVVSGGCE